MGGGQKRLRSEPGSRARLHEERMGRIKRENGRFFQLRYHNRGEAEVVLGSELSAVLRKFVVEWLADRPNVFGGGVLNVDEKELGDFYMGPINYLAEKTEIHVTRVGKIVNGEFDTIGLSQADALLTAANLSHKLGTDELHVIPNPGWSPERWVEYMQSRGCG